MNFEQTSEFDKDLKRLKKKWRSLTKDLEYVKPRIAALYTPREDIDVQKYRDELFTTKKAAILYVSESVEVVKMRLDVESLGSNSKVRIVFVAVKTENEIVFVELFAKNDKEREDPIRYKPYKI